MMSFEELQKELEKIMNEHNSRSSADFEGYSPEEMHHILYFPMSEKSPVKFLPLSEKDYQKIPFLNQIKYFGSLLEKHTEIKLTQKGFLPTSMVADIYDRKFIKEDIIDLMSKKPYKERDSSSVHLTRILAEMAGLTKKRKGKLSLTKNGKKILNNDFELLKLIFSTFAHKFNWAYFDGYDLDDVGQMGYGFSLVLLSKYGNKNRHHSFYADKYLNAFPQLLFNFRPTYSSAREIGARCYSLRTFDRFLKYFGFIAIDQNTEHLWEYDKNIRKTDLFDKFIKCNPPGVL